MRAVVYSRYGSPEVLRLAEVPKPAPRADEILVAVRATTVAAGDVRMRTANPLTARIYNGLFKPTRVTVLGFELAGDVEAAGREVRRFREGDPVFAFTGFRFGAYAEHLCLPAEGTVKQGLVSLKPTNMTCEEAAALPVGGLTAQAFLRKAGVKKGQRILIYGASGSVGTYAVQLARHLGADVAGVCSNSNLDLVRSLGAQRVIDYTAEDFSAGSERFDLVFDAVGKAPASRCRAILAPNGVHLSVMGSAEVLPRDLAALKELVEVGAVRAVIDRCYPLEQIVDAHRYVEAGHKRGNVVIAIGRGSRS
jgi:NADPH:quinone reductase-like Zn-dependent oxidoreductase